MKKLLCALMTLALLTGCAALAAPAPSAAPGETEAATPDPQTEPTESTPTDAPSDAPEETKAPEMIRIGFEDGFALELPEGWLFHPTDADMAAQGVVYCLSDAEGKGWLYAQVWDTDCADLNELKALIDRTTDIQTSGAYNFNGTDFVVYDLTEGDVSCCAALLNGKVLNLVFTPQSDASYMAVAAQILNTFELL